MNNKENFEETEMKNITGRYKIKPVPESLMKNYLAQVRGKIETEKSKGQGIGFPVWMGAIVFTYSLGLALSFGVYWVEGRPAPANAAKIVIEADEVQMSVPAVPVQAPAPTPRPSSIDIKIESDAELGALLSALGEDDNIFDEQDIPVEMERFDQMEIQGPSTAAVY